MDIKTLSETELKALAFDEMVKIEHAQNNLRVINQELANRKHVEVSKKDVKTS